MRRGVARVVTLLTDFGRRDPWVGEMQAALYTSWAEASVAAAPVVHLGHNIEAGDIAAASWFLERVWRRFPQGSVHLAVVDPGVGSARPIVAATAGGHRFVAPGNGLLAFLRPETDLRVVRVTPKPDAKVSTTFHGRDLMAPAAAELAAGAGLGSCGEAADAATLGTLPQVPLPEGAVGRIVWVDRFGNAISDLRRDSDAARALAASDGLRVGDVRVEGPVDCYAAAEPGTPFWYWGSGGTLEVALRDDSAAVRYGWRCGVALHAVAS